jgi:hypothetical protein
LISIRIEITSQVAYTTTGQGFFNVQFCTKWEVLKLYVQL